MFGESALFVDDRHLPLIVVSWFGSPPAEFADALQRMLDGVYARARRVGTQVVVVSDGTGGRVPSLGALRRLASLRHDPELLLEVLAVAPPTNPMIRSMISAIALRIGDPRQRRIVGSYAEALDLASEVLADANLELPDEVPSVALAHRDEMDLPLWASAESRSE